MGFNDEGALVGQWKWAAFDVETAIRDDAIQFFPEVTEDYDSIKPDGRLKDPEKIAADIEAKRLKVKADANAERAAQRDSAALDAHACRIVSIGVQTEADTEPQVWLDDSGDLEHHLLQSFWKTAYGRTLIGYRSRTFDIGRIIQRSRLLGVTHTRNWRRFVAPWGRADGHVDLYDELTLDGLLKAEVIPQKLVTVCKVFGCDVPEDDQTGADMASLVAAGDWGRVRLHNFRDVQRTVALARRLGIVPQAQPQAVEEVF